MTCGMRICTDEICRCSVRWELTPCVYGSCLPSFFPLSVSFLLSSAFPLHYPRSQSCLSLSPVSLSLSLLCCFFLFFFLSESCWVLCPIFSSLSLLIVTQSALLPRAH